MQLVTVDGNGAASQVAYAFSEVAAVYPITPSSTMAEVVEQLAESGATNLYGQSVRVVQMQSEAGAVGGAWSISRWIVGDNVHFLARVVIDDSYFTNWQASYCLA